VSNVTLAHRWVSHESVGVVNHWWMGRSGMLGCGNWIKEKGCAGKRICRPWCVNWGVAGVAAGGMDSVVASDCVGKRA